jgi:diphthamide biosynthesis protein 2
MLMRRYAVIQKARDADVVGILVGTLGVGESSFPLNPFSSKLMNEDWLASYLPLVKYLRSLLTQHHKRSYTISVGKLNPAKLANFLEVECYVLIACPENSLIDAKVMKLEVEDGRPGALTSTPHAQIG